MQYFMYIKIHLPFHKQILLTHGMTEQLHAIVAYHGLQNKNTEGSNLSHLAKCLQKWLGHLLYLNISPIKSKIPIKYCRFLLYMHSSPKLLLSLLLCCSVTLFQALKNNCTETAYFA